MPPKARRGRPKKNTNDPDEARTSESDVDQQDRNSDNENEYGQQDVPMQQEQNDIQLPDDESSIANLNSKFVHLVN